MKNLFPVMAFVLLTGLLVSNVCAQRSTGSISGRVITEGGEPIPNARINLAGVGGITRMLSGRGEIRTDEKGEFQADNLDAAPYSLSVTAPGYVLMPNDRASGAAGVSATKYVHIGESITLQMIRGGVITGRVTTASGEPVVGISVETTRVRDDNGRLTDQYNPFDLSPSRRTDDRGIYRVFGLAPGSYLVSVGGGMSGFSVSPTPFIGRMKIYYPSGTRDTADEVTVRSGEEVTAIDIRYRNERGFSVSGKVTGVSGSGQLGAFGTVTLVTLTKAGTDSLVAASMVSPTAENNGYAIYGISNGEYEITALRPDLSDASVQSSVSRHIVVNGRDITGIDLSVVPTASISGSVQLEKLMGATGQKCDDRDSSLQEIVFRAKQYDSNQKVLPMLSLFGDVGIATPNDKGSFTMAGLKAGRHFIEAQLPDEDWYIKSIILSSATVPTVREAGRNGVVVKAGEKVTGLTITIAKGAAAFKGKIKVADGDRLPQELRVYLVPSEPDARDDLLRFAEVKTDGTSFSFENLAPGKYLVLASATTDNKSPDKPPSPKAWNAAERTRLRTQAEAANNVIELKYCQRLTDFVLPLTK